MKYRCCWTDNDPESWTEVEADDEEDAATTYVEERCSRDPDCYSSFADGELVLVKGRGGTEAYTVTMEMVPHCSARRRA